MRREKGYSLWFVPQEESFRQFQSTIIQFAASLKGTAFSPHLTIVGQAEPESETKVLEAGRQLAGLFPPFQIRLSELTFSSFYYRALTLRAEKNSYLMDARDKARAQLHLSGEEEYNPHLSLFYGDASLAEKLYAASEIPLEIPQQITVDAVRAMKTQGPVEEWICLDTFPLTGHPAG